MSSSDYLGIEISKVNYVTTDLDSDGVTEQSKTLQVLFETQLTGIYGILGSSDFWYEVPVSSLGINFQENSTYVIKLVNDVNKIYLDETYVLYDEIQFTIGGLTEDDKEANRVNAIIASNNKTTEAIEENTKTNKNILEKIVEVLSYINPFSDNFFGKKLVDLILDGLKSLFVPSDDFFTNWFDDLNSWLGDRFGILYFPVEIVLDFLNRVGGLAETTDYTLTIPSFKLSFMGYEAVFFSGYTYDFNELLVNETFKNIHTIYLTIVDVILYLCLIVLSYNTFVDVFGGKYIDDALHDVYDYAEGQKMENNKRTIGFDTGSRRR